MTKRNHFHSFIFCSSMYACLCSCDCHIFFSVSSSFLLTKIADTLDTKAFFESDKTKLATSHLLRITTFVHNALQSIERWSAKEERKIRFNTHIRLHDDILKIYVIFMIHKIVLWNVIFFRSLFYLRLPVIVVIHSFIFIVFLNNFWIFIFEFLTGNCLTLLHFLSVILVFPLHFFFLSCLFLFFCSALSQVCSAAKQRKRNPLDGREI